MMKSFQQKKMTISVACFEYDSWTYVVIMKQPQTLMRPISKQGRNLQGVSDEKTLAEDIDYFIKDVLK